MEEKLQNHISVADAGSESASDENSKHPSQLIPDLVVDSDEALNRKMFLVNNALDEIGFTWYHAKLFLLAGFGYSVDSQLETIQSSVKTVVDHQFGIDFPIATEVFYIGLLVGAVFWGFGADIIGRKTSFNLSLLLAAVFGLITGGMSSYPTYCIFMALSAFGAGGNIATDVTVFLEFSPSKFTWLTTLMAAWWGVGQTVAVLIAWAFVPSFSCPADGECPSSINHGWRYCWYVNSGIVLALGLARLLFFDMDESPKYLVSNGRDAEAVETLQGIAKKYNRPCSLTLEDLLDCGEVADAHNFKTEGYTIKTVSSAVVSHIKVLFSTKKIAYSSTLIFLSWILIGIAYGTFFNFVYIYIDLHGGDTSASTFITYRNSSISQFVGIFGPFVAAYMVRIRWLGRRGTMAIGAIATMAILFGYTSVRTQTQDAAFASMTYFLINIYFACLYAYTPEVFPAIARATGGAMGVFLQGGRYLHPHYLLLWPAVRVLGSYLGMWCSHWGFGVDFHAFTIRTHALPVCLGSATL
ncbi:hypothetical protein JCM33374_g2288 [Metschnikowia sp. JCM 33374]|nr:hypothetical protein JCM33374_g2288 [Metschnikowia sp. JCM 33374]